MGGVCLRADRDEMNPEKEKHRGRSHVFFGSRSREALIGRLEKKTTIGVV